MMHPLLYILQDHDYGHLRIIAEFWGLDLPSDSSLAAAKWLSAAMLNEQNILEITESLPKIARQTFDDLLSQGGRAAYADMAHRYGPIREMGAGRRDRTKPWRDPSSPLEMLWYRGLVARAFADTMSGPREFIYIPSDLLPFLPPHPSIEDFIPGGEIETPKYVKLASSIAVEDAATLLSSLRRKPMKSMRLEQTRREALIPFLHQPQSIDLIMKLMTEMGLLTSKPVQPQLEAARDFLEIPQERACGLLLTTWRDSVKWNDLKHIGGVHTSGDPWPNDPLTSRCAALNFLRPIPTGKWWQIHPFIQAIRQHYPSYLRPGGDFDSWYLQDEETEIFLRGFEHWDRIDGALIRYILTGPLHFLGATDLGTKGPDQAPYAFRLAPRSRLLFDADFEHAQIETAGPISIFLDGTILASVSCQQSHRYQIARFCDWLERTPSGHRYRLSPSALQRAAEQGLSLQQVQSILERASQSPLPSSLLEAFARWEKKGREAYVQKMVVLRLQEPQILQELQSDYATARYLQEKLGPATIVVREEDVEKLYSAAARLGILIDPL